VIFGLFPSVSVPLTVMIPGAPLEQGRIHGRVCVPMTIVSGPTLRLLRDIRLVWMRGEQLGKSVAGLA
jgi:hypothetical protein